MRKHVAEYGYYCTLQYPGLTSLEQFRTERIQIDEAVAVTRVALDEEACLNFEQKGRKQS